MTELRLPEPSWTMTDPVTVHPGESLPVPSVHGSALEVAVTLQAAADATAAASVYLMSDDAEGRQPFGGSEARVDDCCGVAITVSWQEQTLKASSSCRRHAESAAVRVHAPRVGLLHRCSRLSHQSSVQQLTEVAGCMLQVSWPQTVDRNGVTVDLASARRKVGGPVAVQRRSPVRLRVFLDHSALEARLPLKPSYNEPLDAPHAARALDANAGVQPCRYF